MKRKPVLLALAGLLVAVAVAGGGWWLHAGGTQRLAASFLPPVPNLETAPAAMREHIATADARARRRLTAGRGLRELGQLYQANGFPDEAARCYRGLIQLDPTEPRWPHLLATILAGYGEIEPALELWDKVRVLAPDYIPARLRIGDCLLKANQPAKAVAAYEAVLQREPENPYALLGLARLDLEAGRWDNARQRLEQVVSKSNYTLGYDLIVSLYDRMGLTQQAAAIRGMAKASGAYRDPADPWLDALLDHCFEPYRLSLEAGTVARNGDSAAALRLLERALAVAPDDVSVRFQLGTLLATQGQSAAAQEQLEKCTSLAPDFADGWAHLSDLQAKAGDRAGAARTLATGLARCPDSPGLHLMQARNLRAAGQTGAAIAEYQESIRLRPNESEAYVELGNLYIELGNDEAGIREMRRAIEADPGDSAALGLLAFQAISTGKEAEARQWLARIANQPRVPREQSAALLEAYRQAFGRAFTPVRPEN